ncbi:unnamed protein product [Pieris macdunnoughi]|uniref:Uncharacterized protein n=1 Tax=Pieris macdunnoughi TaxID=345717 RepID=A0A821M694_9NEOP|nr:unnamed protein product [Pieris macdunnoughi]
MWISIYLVTTVFVLITAQSSEDFTTYTGPYSLNPSTVNFNDIYSNHMLNDNDDTLDDPNSIPTQFIEFHPKLLQISPITQKGLLSSKKAEESEYGSSTTEDNQVKVIPMRNHHRGVLDVLFPAARVRTFKNIFDTFRRVLSYTF